MQTKTASKPAAGAEANKTDKNKPASANDTKKASNVEEKCICQICTCG